MKKIILSLAASAFLGLNSCSDSFLELTPKDKIVGTTFYETKADIFQALVAAYDPLSWDNWSFGQYNSLNVVSDVMSDDIRVGGAGISDMAQWHEMRFFKAKASNTIVGLWTICYSGIYRANLVIENMHNIRNIDDASKQQFLAEAYYLKAYYYHILWKFWGNVVFYEQNLTNPYTAPQTTADELYQHIIRYLDIALADGALPRDLAAAQYGRVTLDAARMLKARVVMYQNDTSKYPEVLRDMQALISSNKYSLFADFEKLFMDAGEWSPETIWEINFVDDSNSSWGNPIAGQGTVLPTLIGINGLSGSSVFEGGWGFSPVEPALYNLYEANDQRKDGGILAWAKILEADPGATYAPRYDDTKLFNKKYTRRKGYNSGATFDQDLNFRNNMRIYRYSEALLNAAELLLRTGGSTGEAQTYYDKVRQRALGVSFVQRTVSLDNILLERRLEFALEGHRFWDLVRFGKAEEVLGARGYTSNKKHLPIPQSEIDKSQSVIRQNPY